MSAVTAATDTAPPPHTAADTDAADTAPPPDTAAATAAATDATDTCFLKIM